KHQGLSKTEAKKRGIDLLKLVGIPNPERRIDQYPHEFSGGMRQRAMIAIALSCNPRMLIADEPTTALDVTIQAQILELLRDIQEETKTAIILTTHDLGVVANAADRVAVMYGGKIRETGTVGEMFYQPKQPSTWRLLGTMPKSNDTRIDTQAIPGTPHDLKDPPKDCPFSPRCTYEMKVCDTHMPEYHKSSVSQKTA